MALTASLVMTLVNILFQSVKAVRKLPQPSFRNNWVNIIVVENFADERLTETETELITLGAVQPHLSLQMYPGIVGIKVRYWK